MLHRLLTRLCKRCNLGVPLGQYDNVSMVVLLLMLMSSANEVWVGHRNAGRPSVHPSVGPSICLSVLPSVCLSFCPSDLWTQYLKNRFTNRLQFWNMTSDHRKYRRYWFWAMCENKDGAIELFNMYAIDTPCERDILRTALPINFKFGLWCHTIYRTDTIDLGHVQKLRWPPTNVLICML